MDPISGRPWKVGARLFVLSFTALFLELMIIRWVPSEVRLVAYYANLMLISSFLGLGVGALLGTRGWSLFRWFAPLFALNVLQLILIGDAPAGRGEWRFFVGAEPNALRYVMLASIFFVNAASFVPLGEEIGIQFHRLPSLRAYSWDLGGSLAGTVCFGFFSLLHFSPIQGMSLVVVIALALSGRKRWSFSFVCYAAALAAILLSANQRAAYWSPYYYITINETRVRHVPNMPGAIMLDDTAWSGRVPPNIRGMQDPPFLTVQVNQDFYQLHGTLNPLRYTAGGPQSALVSALWGQYALPYRIVSAPENVLVLGAGGGLDVEAALLNGAHRVDAVEIDPILPRLSSRINAAAPYSDPRVVLHVDDARAFLQNNNDRFDLIVFGFLDSQALFSYGASLRLDGYTYTVESFRKAFEHLTDTGSMSVSFALGREWAALKLSQMLRQATGRDPLMYDRQGNVIMIVTKGEFRPNYPTDFFGFKQVRVDSAPVDLATDDWPYLYLLRRDIPYDYRIVIGLLLLLSTAAVLLLRGTRFGATDAHFLFLGWGFLLLQTKAIGDCSLYFGTTWFVTTLVITGVLSMVLLANLVAIRLVRFTPWLYLPLFAALLVLFVPRELILGQTLPIRMLWTLTAVPLPIFFAGLIFSTTFRNAGNPSSSFGANLIGATIGGFCEYLGMAFGTSALSYIVILAYVASLLCVLRTRMSGHRLLSNGLSTC